MLGWLKRLFGKDETDYSDPEEEAWQDEKDQIMDQMLGEMHDLVGHSLIPFFLGGSLHQYYFPNHIEGVGIATKELTSAGPEGASNKRYDAYELVMFTRHPLDPELSQDDATPFGKAQANINTLLNLIARYSEEAELNPNETCEFPEDMEEVGGKCLVFDGYAEQQVNGKTFGLLLIIEVFRAEMEYAREHGGGELIAKLKQAGAYPYSDLDRDPVV